VISLQDNDWQLQTALPNLENQLFHECLLVFWPFYWIKPQIRIFWTNSTVVANSADWLHLSTFPPMGDALPQNRRLLDTWKNGFAIKAS